MGIKEKIRPIYSELQGYLAQAPETASSSSWSSDQNLWKQMNSAINELDGISGKDYSRFKIVPESSQFAPGVYRQTMTFSSYKANLGGLIARLHAEYFSDEEPPFKNMPGTVINQTQNQTQSQSISVLLLELQEKIATEIPKHKEGSKERTFLEKVKSVLPSMKTTTDILSGILKVGAELGLNAADIAKLIPF